MDSLKDYISTREASERTGLAQEYLAYLAAQGTVKGVKVARNWLIYLPSLEEYNKNRPKPGPKPHSRRDQRKTRP